MLARRSSTVADAGSPLLNFQARKMSIQKRIRTQCTFELRLIVCRVIFSLVVLPEWWFGHGYLRSVFLEMANGGRRASRSQGSEKSYFSFTGEQTWCHRRGSMGARNLGLRRFLAQKLLQPIVTLCTSLGLQRNNSRRKRQSSWQKARLPIPPLLLQWTGEAIAAVQAHQKNPPATSPHQRRWRGHSQKLNQRLHQKGMMRQH